MKTVILLRHADIDEVPGGAPLDHPLNAAGQARAVELAHAAGVAGVTTIYVSDALRTKQTVAPLAAALHLTPTQVPDGPAFVPQVAAAATGPVLLIAGHSNTVPAMIAALGAQPPVSLVQGHEDLFVVTVLGGGKAHVTRLAYGARST